MASEYTRRQVLGAALAAGPLLPARSKKQAGARGLATPTFPLGIASGDPNATSVVLWTQLAPTASLRLSVEWEVAIDEGFRQIVTGGTHAVTAADGFSVHAIATGLRADNQYFYRFRHDGKLSPVGRTKTAPSAQSSVGRLRFAVVSCQNYETGYWPVFDAIAADELDLIVHLGDAIYEGDPSTTALPGRRHKAPQRPGGLKTLADYRSRWAQYRSDPALQKAMASAPWWCVNDDHEIVNNVAAPPAGDAAASARRAAAYQAMWEHLPIRTRPDGASWELNRRLDWGRLARLNLLDTRQHREPQARGEDGSTVGAVAVGDRPERMINAEQEAWLLAGCADSPATWNVIAQQVVMAPVRIVNPAVLLGSEGPAAVVNLDQWDGYAQQRARILSMLAKQKTSNVIVLSGDIHTAWVNDLLTNPADPDSKVMGTEFVCTSVSSKTDSRLGPLLALSNIQLNPHVKFFDARRGGYLLMTVTPTEWRCDLRLADDVEKRTSPVSTVASHVVKSGTPRARRL
jgi:alkaline phosphatase D